MFTYVQYEGGAMEGGRGPSIWDTFTHQHPGMCTPSLCFLSKIWQQLYLSIKKKQEFMYRKPKGLKALKLLGHPQWEFHVTVSNTSIFWKQCIGVSWG
jgi:hypothetical protein